MTELILAGLALIAGAAVGIATLTVSLIVMTSEASKKAVEHVKQELRLEHALRLIAENERNGLKKQMELQSSAIESSALPWYPKTEKMEARYEIEAIDRMENPYAYNDLVDGLGRA